MLNLESTLAKYNLTMPAAPAKGGIYTPAREFGENLVYMSGCGPNFPGGTAYSGKLGREYTLEEGQQAARCCALNLLAVLQRDLGDLSRVKRIAKMLALVACADDFYDQPAVANGASQLLVDVFGEDIGLAARSAIGTNALPGNIPVEIELLIEVYPE
jgi:enamine deaminase RidA (YjgF/YER057c/UK114 family)